VHVQHLTSPMLRNRMQAGDLFRIPVVQVASQVSGEMDYDDLRAKLKAGEALYAIITLICSFLLGHSFVCLFVCLFVCSAPSPLCVLRAFVRYLW
jgi:hypothetical protein